MNDEFSEALEKYSDYINNILFQIKDFDVWYETIEKKTFPKEWYKFIRNTNNVTDK